MSALSGPFLEIKRGVLRALGDTAQLAESVGMHSLAGELQKSRIPKLEEERFALVVLGDFTHGKSTFVNAPAGAPILPAGITPPTATINPLVYADEPRATAQLTDGTSREVDP